MTTEPEPSIRSEMTGDGEVSIADTVIAKLACRGARSSDGVAGMHQSPLRRLARFLPDSAVEGVRVEFDDGELDVTLDVVLDKGANVASVTAAVEQNVRHELVEVCGIAVRHVAVNVRDLRT